MKKYYLLLLLFTFVAQGQIVNIPDPIFKALLTATTDLEYYASDSTGTSMIINSNGDGEIDEQEAALVYQLDFNNLNCTSIVGIEAFTQLRTLVFNSNQVSALHIATLTHLTYLSAGSNQITEVTLPNTSTLVFIDLSNNHIQSVVLPEHGNFDVIALDNNQLSSIDLSHLNYTYGLGLSNNNLTEIVFNNPTHTNFGNDCYLRFSGNPLTNLDMSGIRTPTASWFTGLDRIEINNTLLTSITMPRAKTKYISISNNPNLEHINMKDGTGFTWGNEGPVNCGITITNNPNLSSICVDDFEYDFFVNQLAIPNVAITSYCNFIPGGESNTITGSVIYRCNSIALPLRNKSVTISNDTSPAQVTTNNSGVFTFNVGTGNYTVSPNLLNPSYFTVTPPSYTFNFNSLNTTETANFCLATNGIHLDVQVEIVPITRALPGFDAKYMIIYKNVGNQVQSGTVTLNYDDSVLDFISSTIPITSSANNLLTWDYIDLEPFEQRVIYVTLNVNSPMEIPAVNIGNTLHYTASITTVGLENNYFNNEMSLHQIVVGSYDPNDKEAVEGAQITPTQAQDYLHYVVRFQNTGTFYAQNVVIKDMLSDNLDWNTLQMVAGSHPYRTSLTNGNKLEVIFENINLPAAIDDEPGSHGFIAFSIKPKSTIALNDVIANTANIYFDYNFPIVTNTVETTVAELNTTAFENNTFTLYPNPTKGELYIDLPIGASLKTVTIYNTLGQLLLSKNTATTIDVSTLSQGTYFITIETDYGKATQQFVKL